ncbi:MAG: hypothetical protein ACLQVD_08160 [Capsulimonadaceae bacterium]
MWCTFSVNPRRASHDPAERLQTAVVLAGLSTVLGSPTTASAAGSTAMTPPPSSSRSAPELRCLIVGGGPDRPDNQIGIESNVRYVRSLLPPGCPVRVLYANGRNTQRIVEYEDAQGNDSYERPSLEHIDGPSTFDSYSANLEDLSKRGREPYLLYFTGHGSPDEAGNYAENGYDLWGTDELTPSDIEDSLKSIDTLAPLTLVMVQCFSGTFANDFFTGSTRTRPRVRPKSCGFFASIAQREAAGCTDEVDEADYHDFTTYFFGALSGHDRLGRLVTGADFDHDGKVEMDEAYAYALINDPSIDTPVATSDAYVRRFCNASDEDIFATPWPHVLMWADPAQLAALDALSTQLKLSGDDRLKLAYAEFRKRVGVDEDSITEDEDERTAVWIRFTRLAKTVVLEHLIRQSGTPAVQAGLAELIAAEHTNPLEIPVVAAAR